MKLKERDKSIDIMKGILIFFVIIGHYPSINERIQSIIYWFHMPLFFMISGYLFKKKKIKYG